MINQRARDFIFDVVLVIGVLMAVYATGCTQIKLARYAEPVCEMACDEVEVITVENCHGICDNALAGRAVDLKVPCYYACEEAVMTGKPKCVDACEAGVTAAVEAIETD